MTSYAASSANVIASVGSHDDVVDPGARRFSVAVATKSGNSSSVRTERASWPRHAAKKPLPVPTLERAIVRLDRERLQDAAFDFRREHRLAVRRAARSCRRTRGRGSAGGTNSSRGTRCSASSTREIEDFPRADLLLDHLAACGLDVEHAMSGWESGDAWRARRLRSLADHKPSSVIMVNLAGTRDPFRYAAAATVHITRTFLG